jgi:hypothetical protein
MSIYDVLKRGKVTQNAKSPQEVTAIIFSTLSYGFAAFISCCTSQNKYRVSNVARGRVIRPHNPNHLLFSKPLALAILPKEPHLTLELIFVFRNTIRSYLRLVWKPKSTPNASYTCLMSFPSFSNFGFRIHGTRPMHQIQIDIIKSNFRQSSPQVYFQMLFIHIVHLLRQCVTQLTFF